MNKRPWILASLITTLTAALAVPQPVLAQNVELFTEDISAFPVQSVGDGTTWGVVVGSPTNACPFGTGDALRMFNINPTAAVKPELQGDLPLVLFGPFQVSMQVCNQSIATSTNGASIRWRMGNAGESLSGFGDSALSVSFHSDLSISATYLSSTNTREDVEMTPAAGVHDLLLVGNGSTNETYEYTIFGQTRTLNPLSYDVFIDEVLLNSDPEFANGMGFITGALTPDYDSAQGLRRVALIGSGTGQEDPDVWFDNVFLNIGEIPVPVDIAEIVNSQADAFSFTSTSGTVYALQSSTNGTAAIPIWVDAGLEVTGDGTDQVLFDPAGFDTNKTYRIIEAP